MRKVLLIFLLGSIHCVFGGTLDSLQYQIHQGSANEKLNALLELGWQLRLQHPDSALLLLQQSEQMALKTKDQEALLTVLIRKGVLLRNKGQVDQSVLLFEEALRLAQTQNDSLGKCRVLVNLGQSLKRQGAYEKAIEQLLDAIALLEKLKHAKYQDIAYTTLAGIYVEQARFRRALGCYQKLLDRALNRQDSSSMTRSWYNMGIAHFYLDEMDTALSYFQKCLDLAIRQNNVIKQAQILNAIGSLKFEEGKLKQAQDYFLMAQQMAQKTNLNLELIKILNNLAAVHEQWKEWPEALNYYRQAAQRAHASNTPSQLIPVYSNLSQTFEQMRIPDSALHYFQRYSHLKDSIFNVETNRQIVALQEQYESAQKDKDIASLKEMDTRQKAAIEKRNFWLTGIGIFSILLILILINYFGKLRIQKRLVKKTEELHQQKTVELLHENSVKTMKAYLDGETSERQRLAGDLHDQLGSQLAAVTLYHDHLNAQHQESASGNQWQKANSMLHQAIADVRKIAHNLAADTLTQFGLEAAIHELCETLSESGQLMVRFTAIGMEKRLPAMLELVLIRCVQELVANVIKHAEATEMRIELRRLDDEIILRIRDNGKGISPTAISSPGFGLKNIAQRIATLAGTFNMESTPGEGTTSHLSIPIET